MSRKDEIQPNIQVVINGDVTINCRGKEKKGGLIKSFFFAMLSYGFKNIDKIPAIFDN